MSENSLVHIILNKLKEKIHRALDGRLVSIDRWLLYLDPRIDWESALFRGDGSSGAVNMQRYRISFAFRKGQHTECFMEKKQQIKA